MNDLQRHYRQRCIAKTDVRLARYSFGFRPIVVPFEANSNSPAACDPLPPKGRRGEGETVNSPTVAPASSVSSFLHGSH